MSIYTRIMVLGAVFSAILTVGVWAVEPGAVVEPMSAGAAVEAAGAAVATESAEATPAGQADAGRRFVPYIGKIIGDRVNIRSGGAQIYYPVGQLGKADRVVVQQERLGWGMIEPTQGCFSYIAKEFVRLEGVVEHDVAEAVEAEAVEAEAVEPVVEVAKDKDVEAGLVAGEQAEAVATVEAAGAVVIEEAAGAAAVEEGVKVTEVSVAAVGEVIVQAGARRGVVTRDVVRVRAGSVKVPPAFANQVQTKLNTGDVVTVIGERDDYYKIVPPKGCYFWVSLDYVERVGPADAEALAEIREQSKPAVVAVKETAETQMAREIEEQRAEYAAVVKLLAAEQGKALGQQDFSVIKSRLDTLVEQAKSVSVKASAMALGQQVARSESARQLWAMSRDQDDQLAQRLAKIDAQVQQLAAVNAPVGQGAEDIVIKGRLARSSVFTAANNNERFLVLDDAEKIECYAIAGRLGLDMSQWLGKRVSLMGQAKYDVASKSRVVYVSSVVELPPGM